MSLEEHGDGNQRVRMRSWPVPSLAAVGLGTVLVGLAVLAYFDRAPMAAAVIAVAAALLAIWCSRDCAAALGALHAGIRLDAERHSGEFPMVAGQSGSGAQATTASGSEATKPLRVPTAASPCAGAALAHVGPVDEGAQAR